MAGSRQAQYGCVVDPSRQIFIHIQAEPPAHPLAGDRM